MKLNKVDVTVSGSGEQASHVVFPWFLPQVVPVKSGQWVGVSTFSVLSC